MSRLDTAIRQIVHSRAYTNRILSTIDDADWYRMPESAHTHIAWQVGHIAVAHYALALLRIRDNRAEDETLIPKAFRDHFNRGSTPVSDSPNNPPVSEIKAVFDRVHEQVLVELPNVSEADLDQPPLHAHDLLETKLDTLHWTAKHEMLHVGQIGLIRRLFGMEKFR